MANCVNPMGLYQPVFGYDGSSNLNFTLKKKWQWQFLLTNISTGTAAAEPLPCIKASRPKLTFREMQAEHLNEVIYYPSKPDWQPIQIVFYDRCIQSQNPIITWIAQQYDPNPSTGCSSWKPCIDSLSFKPCASLVLYDGCGNVIEGWQLEHVYPLNIDFGELDMNSSEVVTFDLTLRYDRAWQYYPATPHVIYEDQDTDCNNCEDATCGSDDSDSSMAAAQMFQKKLQGFSNFTPQKKVEIEPDFVMF